MRLLFCSLLLGLQACSQGNPKLDTYDQFRSQKMEARDSLFVLYTVKEWGIQEYYSWALRTDISYITPNDVTYFIAGVFYSPDKKKMLVWVGDKKYNARDRIGFSEDTSLNKICPTSGDTIYKLSAIIGIRDGVKETWKLYPFDQQIAGCSERKEWCINVLGQYYFEKMKTHQMHVVAQSGEKKGHRELQAFGYNLQEKDFWDKCWLFQKDTVCSYGLYPFQIYVYKCDITDYNVMSKIYPDQTKEETNGEYLARGGRVVMEQYKKSPKDCAEPHKPPKINYPKEILEMFE